MKFSVLQQNRIVFSNSMQEKLLSISSNGLGNEITVYYVMTTCYITLSAGTSNVMMMSLTDDNNANFH